MEGSKVSTSCESGRTEETYVLLCTFAQVIRNKELVVAECVGGWRCSEETEGEDGEIEEEHDEEGRVEHGCAHGQKWYNDVEYTVSVSYGFGIRWLFTRGFLMSSDYLEEFI